jgi:hypothetical protein
VNYLRLKSRINVQDKDVGLIHFDAQNPLRLLACLLPLIS